MYGCSVNWIELPWNLAELKCIIWIWDAFYQTSLNSAKSKQVRLLQRYSYWLVNCYLNYLCLLRFWFDLSMCDHFHGVMKWFGYIPSVFCFSFRWAFQSNWVSSSYSLRSISSKWTSLSALSIEIHRNSQWNLNLPNGLKQHLKWRCRWNIH